jgi:methylated-DNA-[protein]-cysteine S-methyltransferase
VPEAVKGPLDAPFEGYSFGNRTPAADRMAASAKPNVLIVFHSRLGWMAIVHSGGMVRQLTFAHPSSHAALEACDPALLENARYPPRNEPLVCRLQAFACGAPVDFSDVPIDVGGLSEFQRRVVRCCRRIPYGQTLSYGELAAQAGSPGAARAVGNCMAANPVPLIVPCHRVVRADGCLGSYSAPGGTRTKKRLLALEGLRFD